MKPVPGGEDVITAFTTICNKSWQTGEWPTPWTQSSVITLPKKSASSVIQAKSCWRSYWTDWSHKRTGRLQSRKEYHRADLQPTHSMWEISPAPARPLPCLHRLLEGYRQGLACSFVGNHEEVQHQHKPYPSHQKPLLQGHHCRPLQQRHRRLVPNNLFGPGGEIKR